MVDKCVSFGMTGYSNSNDCSFTGAEFGVVSLEYVTSRMCQVSIVCMVDECVSFGMTDYSNSNDCSFTGAGFGALSLEYTNS